MFDCRTQSNDWSSIGFDWFFVRFCSIGLVGHANTVTLTPLPTCQDGVENRDNLLCFVPRTDLSPNTVTVCKRAWIETNMAVNINADNKDTDELPEKIVISLQCDPAVGKLCQSLFRTSAQEPCPRKSLLRYRPPSLYSIYSARNS